ncbi:MAG: InlB B-repeat-containing protein, partial [Clostridia bacterium]|nr:InlB B-repeat-containing protein [Clostridia bacterium]
MPDVERDHYIFNGWYADENFSGEAVESIEKSSTGNVEYWAKWTAETYSVEYYIDNVAYNESGVTTYTYDVETDLPAPIKENYSFTGWYDNSDLTGTSVMEIAQGEYGNKTYYATWTPDSYKITFNADGGTIKNTITGYSYGVETTLPVPTKTGYAFDGWYETSDFSGSKWEVITVGETGDKTFYAKWTQTNILACAGYEEGAYVNIYTNGNSLSNISVSYKSLDGSHAYQAIDRELIREYDGYVRADIVGLAEGAYSLEINVGGTKEYKDVSVTSYDRSGYAFYNRSAYATDTTASEGVGGYKDDGTPKDNAQIIYFSEGNKNTQTVNFTGTSYNFTGIGEVLTNLYRAKNPVIIRIVGKISAATWKLLDYNADKKYSASNKMPVANVIGINNKPLTDATSLTQADLILAGYNELDTSEYSELLGLSSKATYSSGAFDSAWNDCSITKGAHDVTVEGIGTDAEIFQWGMTWKQASSIEVRNITFSDYTEDACAFQGDTNVKTGATANFDSYYIWLHNCTFNRGKNYWDLTDEQDKHDGDGSTDLKLVYGVTLSYNHYVNTHKTGLVGASDTSYSYNITYHHNYYEGCESRMPLARLANMHMYNNYYK